ncbi:uncharacterized protein N7443_006604 [Penicillium atrosanguineum]|nr:uncharacterized protein N7443_006604 [Penicillium atrosanguineum]KAJ5298484.1 hypothetical protein N7443_006604 [Penicillium atrosanguineum]
MDVNQHFQQLDQQFEDLHHHLAETARPQSSQSLSPFVSQHFAIPRVQNSRHIDLLDALSASEKYRRENNRPVASPPSSPYNEDVAERNMTRFLRIQYRSGLATSRILSALYQEDVADRNIAKYGDSRSSSSLSSRSSPPAPGGASTVSRTGSRRRGPGKRFPVKPSWTSEGDLRTRSATPDAMSTASSRLSHLSHLVRQQRSAPSLSPEEAAAAYEAEEDAQPDTPRASQRLGVPPAYKQGKRWSTTPLPDSPTLPMPMGDGDGNNGSRSATPVGKPPATAARTSSLTARSASPALASGSKSRKNVRDLSINTKLAASGRPKIAHRAIQPPTPSNNDMKRAPSIAEVMNSPLPTSSPIPLGPDNPSPRFKASEMMDLFNKAYRSTQAVSPHPTYETLQDAIVREINSHEAFRNVPVPVAGPPFTPTATQGSFDPKNIGLNRSASVGSISRLMRKGSFKKHKWNSESRRSISSSVLRRGPGQRRHTDAPPPTPGFLADIQKEQDGMRPNTGEELTYMDVLIRAGNDNPSTSHSKTPFASASRKRHSASTSNLSTLARSTTEISTTTTGTVYCMQAHSSSNDSQNEHEDSDDEILQLPSVSISPPRVQIEGVDENNVRYVIDSSTPVDAEKLINWPQRARNISSQIGCERSLSPRTRARMQLRGARSVETY